MLLSNLAQRDANHATAFENLLSQEGLLYLCNAPDWKLPNQLIPHSQPGQDSLVSVYQIARSNNIPFNPNDNGITVYNRIQNWCQQGGVLQNVVYVPLTLNENEIQNDKDCIAKKMWERKIVLDASNRVLGYPEGTDNYAVQGIERPINDFIAQKHTHLPPAYIMDNLVETFINSPESHRFSNSRNPRIDPPFKNSNTISKYHPLCLLMKKIGDVKSFYSRGSNELTLQEFNQLYQEKINESGSCRSLEKFIFQVHNARVFENIILEQLKSSGIIAVKLGENTHNKNLVATPRRNNQQGSTISDQIEDFMLLPINALNQENKKRLLNDLKNNTFNIHNYPETFKVEVQENNINNTRADLNTDGSQHILELKKYKANSCKYILSYNLNHQTGDLRLFMFRPEDYLPNARRIHKIKAKETMIIPDITVNNYISIKDSQKVFENIIETLGKSKIDANTSINNQENQYPHRRSRYETFDTTPAAVVAKKKKAVYQVRLLNQQEEQRQKINKREITINDVADKQKYYEYLNQQKQNFPKTTVLKAHGTDEVIRCLKYFDGYYRQTMKAEDNLNIEVNQIIVNANGQETVGEKVFEVINGKPHAIAGGLDFGQFNQTLIEANRSQILMPRTWYARQQFDQHGSEISDTFEEHLAKNRLVRAAGIKETENYDYTQNISMPSDLKIKVYENKPNTEIIQEFQKLGFNINHNLDNDSDFIGSHIYTNEEKVTKIREELSKKTPEEIEKFCDDLRVSMVLNLLLDQISSDRDIEDYSNFETNNQNVHHPDRIIDIVDFMKIEKELEQNSEPFEIKYKVYIPATQKYELQSVDVSLIENGKLLPSFCNITSNPVPNFYPILPDPEFEDMIANQIGSYVSDEQILVQQMMLNMGEGELY